MRHAALGELTPALGARIDDIDTIEPRPRAPVR